MVRPSVRLTQALRARAFPTQNVARHQTKRFASNTPGSSTESAQKKAEDALATVQKYAGEAVAAGKRFLGPVGERLGSVLGCTSLVHLRDYEVLSLMNACSLLRLAVL